MYNPHHINRTHKANQPDHSNQLNKNQSPTSQHLEELLVQGQGRVRLVLLTTPGNPTGAVCPLSMQRRILELCRR